MNSVPNFCNHDWYIYELTNSAREWEISNPNNVPMPKGLKRRQKLLPSETPGAYPEIGMYYLECINCGAHSETTSPSIYAWLDEAQELTVMMERQFMDPIKNPFPDEFIFIYEKDEDIHHGFRFLDPDNPEEVDPVRLLKYLEMSDRTFRVEGFDNEGESYKISASEMIERFENCEPDSVIRLKEKTEILEA